MIDAIEGYKKMSSSDLKESIKIFKSRLSVAKEERDTEKILTCEMMIVGCKEILKDRKII